MTHSFWYKLLFGLLLAPVLWFGGFSALATDVDGDGVSDVEEITEFGTNPYVADIAAMVTDAKVNVTSLPQSFSLEGERLLLTGYAPRQAGAIEFRLVGAGETVSVRRVYPDDRGVFSGLWDLRDVCRGPGPGDYHILVQEAAMHFLTLRCGYTEILKSMTFAGEEFPSEHPLALRASSEAVFVAERPAGVRLYAVYESVAFAKDLYTEGEGRIRVAPWKELGAGSHTLTLMPHDPINKVLYEPMVIEFSVVSQLGEQLKSTIYYAPGGIVIIATVFMGSVLYIRRVRALRRGISLAGDEYPDEMY